MRANKCCCRVALLSPQPAGRSPFDLQNDDAEDEIYGWQWRSLAVARGAAAGGGPVAAGDWPRRAPEGGSHEEDEEEEEERNSLESVTPAS